MTDMEKRLAEALRPFAKFGEHAPWIGTVWEHKPDSAPVMVDHRTGIEITAGNFKHAHAILAEHDAQGEEEQ